MRIDFVNRKHDDHITPDDLIRLSQITTEEASEASYEWLHQLNGKIDSCEICKKRYQQYIDIQTFFPNDFEAFAPPKGSALTYVADLLQDKLVALDAKIQEKVEAWLDGAQDLLGSLEQSSFRTVLATDFRNANKETLGFSEITIPLSFNEDGFFEFELPQNCELTFTVKKETDYGQPICLVIFGRNSTVFSGAYALKAISERSENLISGKIPLQVGEYILCVPTNR